MCAPYESYRHPCGPSRTPAPPSAWPHHPMGLVDQSGINQASRHLSLQFTVLLEKPIVAYTPVGKLEV